jgi:hypothetical protein
MYSGLWIAEDHLLCVISNRFMEEYKRFYFQDIQSITIVTTQRRRKWNFVLASLILLTLIAVASLPDGRFFWIWFATIFGFFLFLNNALGPTCTAFLRTAVQVEELSSLNRVRRAHKVLAQLGPLIKSVQGELTPEETSTRLRELFPSRSSVATGPLNL